jgi:uncharacterized protein YecE (DUF72 family)
MKEYIAAVSPLVETGKCFSLLLFVEDKPRSQKRLDYLLAVSSEAVDRRIDVHIAFGHYSWHQHHVLKSLQDAGIGICNAELPLQNAFPLKSYATSEKGYIRYCGAKGMGDHIYSQGDIEERIGGQVELSRKVSHLGIAYCNCFLARAPMNAIQNIHQLNQIFEFSHITGC